MTVAKVEHIKGGTYYFPLKYTNAGLYIYKKRCVLIDSGSSEEEGKQILRYLKQKYLKLESIIITHAHADNCSGASIIKAKTKAKVYSTREEALVLENPSRSTYSAIFTEDVEEEIEIPSEDPNQEPQITKKIVTKHVVLNHKKTLVDKYLQPKKDFIMESTKQSFKIVSLAGHSNGQIGVITPDKVFLIADSLYSDDDIAESPISYYSDLSKANKTLDYLLKSKYTLFLPTRGKPLDFSITSEVYNNQRQIQMVEQTILMHLSMPKTKDELIALVLASFDIEETVPNFYLISSTISSYLDYLKKKKAVRAIHEKGKTRWFSEM